MSGPLLRVAGLTKSFGAILACDGVDLDLRRGEIHAVIGPNGAGKTTLVGQIAGELAPDAGTVRLAGQDITGLPVHARAQRGLGRTFQIASILPAFPAIENVALAVQAKAGHSFRFWRRVGRDADLRGAAEACLETVGLAGRGEIPARDLAHGEQKQLELAMALAGAPSALLLDEPMAGTAREDSGRLIDLLSALRQDRAILLIEHDMDAVFALADRISVLVHGRVLASGPPGAIRGNAEVRRAYLGEDHG